jgi:hypothetical protein
MSAINKIFPTLQLSSTKNLIAGESTRAQALDKLHQLLRLQAIRDSARKVLREGRQDNVIKFMLNKQVAAIGKVSFTDGESPLGPIRVEIESADPNRLIDFLAPRTSGGKPIKEINIQALK